MTPLQAAARRASNLRLALEMAEHNFQHSVRCELPLSDLMDHVEHDHGSPELMAFDGTMWQRARLPMLRHTHATLHATEVAVLRGQVNQAEHDYDQLRMAS